MSERLSVVVPMYNEAEVVEEFCRRLSAVLAEIEMTAEVILVDDGSSDDTWPLIQRMAEQYAGFRGLRLSRNFGHQQALLAGLAVAQGDAVVMMDADLQHPPELTPN